MHRIKVKRTKEKLWRENIMKKNQHLDGKVEGFCVIIVMTEFQS